MYGRGPGFQYSKFWGITKQKNHPVLIECVLSRHDVFSAKSMELRNVQEVLPAWHQFLKLNLQKLLKLDWGGVGFFCLRKPTAKTTDSSHLCRDYQCQSRQNKGNPVVAAHIRLCFFSESSMSNSNNSQRIRLIERIEQTQLIDLSKIIINTSDLILLKTKLHANDWIVFFGR